MSDGEEADPGQDYGDKPESKDYSGQKAGVGPFGMLKWDTIILNDRSYIQLKWEASLKHD